jgi:L-Ala-D/L-Glu epimerase
MRIEHEVIELRTKYAFNIARAVGAPVRRSVWIRVIAEDGAEGWGEAAPNIYYGETADTVTAVLPVYERALNDAFAAAGSTDGNAPGENAAGDGAGDAPAWLNLERAERAVNLAVGHNPAARAGVSAALHDLVGKRLGVATWRQWGLDAAAMPLSSFTIGIDEPDVMRRKLEEAASYPILKVKVGTPHDRQILELVRNGAPDKLVRVDANTGWTVKQAVALLPMLEEFGIELIEQPFAAENLDAFRLLRDRSSIPVIADESCHVAADIPRLAGCVDGINIKLEKCGSLREAVRLVHAARAHHMSVMVGCMMCSTLAIAAAMQIAPLVDWADLDAAALMEHDPFEGPRLEADGRMVLGDRPGLGVQRR